MPIDIKIPRLGWSMEEGVFIGWLKKDGDLVKSGDLLFTLEGEKAAQDIESTDSGTLRIPKDSPQAGATVKVGQVIGLLAADNEAVNANQLPANQPLVEPIKAPATGVKIDPLPHSAAPVIPATTFNETAVAPACSPRARRHAVELGVEVNRLQGSGSTGRIIEADVVKAAASQSNPRMAGQVSTMRRSIAERTALSFSQIPHFYLRAEVDVTRLVEMRENLVGVVEKECGVRITLTDFLLHAQAIALRDFPAVNAVWQNERLVNYTDADIGVVVGLPDGLLIPVIRAAQKLSLVQTARERGRLIEGVRAGRFSAETLAGGATSISNLGTTRTDEFAAIIAPHQSSMLAVGRAAQRPYVVDGRLEIRTTLRLCLSMDHRVTDGGPAAEFLGKIVELLENPAALVNEV
jgi:pyruvate dehydrogenase E2 component (dihydrolipoamide acetyltransferase)